MVLIHHTFVHNSAAEGAFDIFCSCILNAVLVSAAVIVSPAYRLTTTSRAVLLSAKAIEFVIACVTCRFVTALPLTTRMMISWGDRPYHFISNDSGSCVHTQCMCVPSSSRRLPRTGHLYRFARRMSPDTLCRIWCTAVRTRRQWQWH